MRSTFFGLETARRGMVTQQAALYTTGHNISNANTPGYTRQRVDFTTTTPYPSPGLNRPGIAGQMGTGVEAGSVTRIRDQFADLQYRTQNNKVGYFGAAREAMVKMEEIMNEPSDSGLHTTMENFWNSLQTLASNPENTGARDVVGASGQMVADTFNYYYNSLSRVQQDLGNQIEVTAKEVNDTIKSIHNLNKQIAEVEPHGFLPNDLYDSRDQLVDQLSALVNIKVTAVKPTDYGVATGIADGLYNIEMVKEDGNSYQPPIHLIEVTEASGLKGYSEIGVVPNLIENTNSPITSITINGEELLNNNIDFGGELAGLIHSYGYRTVDGEGNSFISGTYPSMIEKLNNMAQSFAEEFNRIHASGYALGETDHPGDVDTSHFFEFDAISPAQTLKVKQTILDNPSTIRAGQANGDAGDNKNAQLLADLKTKPFSQYGDEDDVNYENPTERFSMTGNLDTFYSGVIGALGVDSKSAYQNLTNANIISASIENRRQSTTSVSLDEEMVNMIKFQHAYNASARNITVVDEMLDKIINGMGVVGR